MKKWTRLLAGTLIASLMLSVCPYTAMPVRAEVSDTAPDIASDLVSDDVPDGLLSEKVPDGVLPRKGWNDEQWKLYKRRVAKTIDTETQKIYYIDLDYEAWKDIKIYYKEGWSVPQSEDGFDTMTEIPQSQIFPGCFVFDKTKKEEGSEYYPSGYFYFYDKAQTDSSKNIFQMDFNKFKMDSTAVWVHHVFTVSYEQGEIDMKNLPESKLYSEGGGFDDPRVGLLDEYGSNDLYEGAYYFAGWKDEDGTSYPNSKEITKPVTLHPTFSTDIADKLVTGNYLEKIHVDDTAELLKYATVTGKGKRTVLVIDSDIVLDKASVDDFVDSEVFQDYLQEKGISDYSTYISKGKEGSSSAFGWYNPAVVIEDGGSLTIDNVRIQISGYGDISLCNIVVKDGGSLKVQNQGNIYKYNKTRGFSVSLQKDAKLEITDEAICGLYRLCNHGTVEIQKPVGATKVYSGYVLDVEKDFYNGKTGSITTVWGKIQINNEEQRNVYREPKDNNVNRGTIATEDDGGLELRASRGTNTDASAMIPFLNEGKMICKNVPGNGYYGSPFDFWYVKIRNRGEIKVEQPAHTMEGEQDLTSRSIAGMDLYESVLINEGTLSVKALNGIGVLAEGQSPFFDPAKAGVSKPLGNEVEYTGIHNMAGGTIDLESTKDSIALRLAYQCRLNNYGTITIKRTDMDTVMDNVTLCSKGWIHNEGTITNNGAVGYDYDSSYPDLFGYSGTPCGGRELFRYYLSAVDSGENSLPSSVKVTIKVNGKTLTQKNGSESYHGFLPKNETLQLSATADGYKEGTRTIKTAADMDEFKGGEYSRVWGYYILMENGNGGTGGNGGNGGNGGTGGNGSPAAAVAPTMKFAAASVKKTDGAAAFINSLTKNTDGVITYQSSDASVAAVDKKTGKVTIKGAGKTTITASAAATKKYQAKRISYELTVNPKAASIKSVKNLKGKKIKITWKKLNYTGYKLQYSTDKNFKKAVKTKEIAKNKTVTLTVGKLSKGKTYYVRISSFKKAGKAKYYSDWSKAKSVKVSR